MLDIILLPDELLRGFWRFIYSISRILFFLCIRAIIFVIDSIMLIFTIHIKLMKMLTPSPTCTHFSLYLFTINHCTTKIEDTPN